MFAGKLLTFESGDPASFATFDQFYAAVKAQIKYAIEEAPRQPPGVREAPG